MTVLLLKYGATAGSADIEGKNALHVAAQFSFIDTIAYLGAKAPELLNAKDSNGQTPLMLGVSRSFGYDPTRLLIKLGSPVDEKDIHGTTPCYKTTNHLAIDVLIETGKASRLAVIWISVEISMDGYRVFVISMDIVDIHFKIELWKILSPIGVLAVILLDLISNNH